ncbi:ceramide kinase-like [Haliotis cracherodii]|uniref:ceramide kinase-like n=1 Tax=Haliotis cracherodii TaxID=6455 RepID=UPI0039EB918F
MAEASVLLSGDLLSGGQEYRVHLSPDGLRWQLTNQKKEPAEVSLPWSDIYGLVTDGQGETTQVNGAGKSFTIHFISRRKDKKWRAAEKKFDVKEGDVSAWVVQIQAKYRPATPKSLLVIVNPIGGKGQGQKIYEKKVAGLFKTAGINTHVFITERARHAEEIINNFDFSNVEGIVTVGGDGMYQEALNTLIQRNQKEAGINVNNPESVLKPLDIKFGIIPAGTGNGVTSWACGVNDVETAALHVIRGEVNNFNIFGIYEPGKLVCFSGLLFAYGFFSDVIKKTDEKRWMKTFRYPYVLLTSMFGSRRVYEADIQVLEAPSLENNTQDKRGAESEGAAASPTELGWRRLETREYMDVSMFVCDLNTAGEQLVMDPSSQTITVLLSQHCGGISHLKVILGALTGKKESLQAPQLTVLKNVTAFKIKVKVSDENSSKSEKQKELEHILDIDGEVYRAQTMDLEIRLQSQFVPMFSSPVEVPCVPTTDI